MAEIVKIEFTGFKELSDIFKELDSDFGQKDSKSILNRAVRQSMQPVLSQAKALAPKDTGALATTLRIEARKPSRKDKRSKYISETDSVIGAVTTKPIPKKLLKQAKEAFGNGKQARADKKKFFAEKGYIYDMRAAAMEYGFKHYITKEMGTAKVPAQPFMRPALEGQSSNVIESLAENLRTAITKYKAKQAKKESKR